MANPTEYIDISDFTPGIFSDYHASNGNPVATANGFVRGKNGAAVLEDTYRCCADISGALVPLPKKTANKTLTIPANTTTAYWPTNHLAYYILDAAIMGPTAESTSVALSNKDLSANDNYELAVQFSFWYASDGAGVASGYWNYTLCRLFPNTTGGPAQKDPWFDKSISARHATGDFPRDIPAGGLVWIRASNDASIVPDNIYNNLTGIFSGLFEHAVATAISANDAALTTADTDWTGGYYSSSQNTTGATLFLGGAIFHYPNPDTAPGASYWVNPGTYRPRHPSLVVTHQDRVVTVGREFKSFDNVIYPYQDVFAYTAAFDPAGLAALSRPFRTLFGSENPSGVGVMASISADRLFIVKHHGGGYMVLGDLNNPTIQKLPFLESTFGVASYPAMTPFGVCYGTRNGVFMWSGGESVEKLSQQIEGFFWNVAVSGHSDYGGSQGRFAWWHPWIMVPNNFMFDTRTKGWWRLDEVLAGPPAGVTDTNGYYNAPFHVYVVNPANGKLHALPKLVSHTQTAVDYVFDPSSLATSYSWKSQPLVETRMRVRSFQDITLVASGRGTQTVTITLNGFNELGQALAPVSEEFEWTSETADGYPVILRHNIKSNFVAMNVQVRIQVSTSTYAAAKIHSVTIGTAERARTRTDRATHV